MNFLWDDVFEFFKERRRAFLFVATIFLFIFLPLAGTILHEILGPEDFREFLKYAIPVLGGVLALWIFAVARRLLAPTGRYEPSPLSRDELAKARSKLVKAKNDE